MNKTAMFKSKMKSVVCLSVSIFGILTMLSFFVSPGNDISQSDIFLRAAAADENSSKSKPYREYSCGENESFRIDVPTGFVSVTEKSENSAVTLSGLTAAAQKIGKAEFTFIYEDGKSLLVRINVYSAPEKVELNASEIRLGVGESFEFNAVTNKGSFAKALTYKANDTKILSYQGSGKFKAKKIGKAAVTVTTYNGKTAKCTVTVLPAPKSISLNKQQVMLGVGEIIKLKAATNEGSYSREIIYKSGNTKLLSDQGSGRFKAEKVGTTTVTVTTYNGKTAKCTVTVLAAPKSVSLNAQKVTLGVGESFNFNAKANKGSYSRQLTYKADNPKLLTYHGRGIFKAEKLGKTSVSVTTYNGKTAKCTVSVLPYPSSIKTKQSSYTLQIGHTKKINLILPKNTACNTYKFSSSNPSVAYMKNNRTLYARKMGSATITITSVNNKTTSFNVKVTAMNVPYVSQYPKYPTGCEAASCTSLLKYYGYHITLDQMVAAIPAQKIRYKNGKRYGPDINKSFVGDPKGSYTSGVPGYGAFSPIVTKSLQKVINQRGGKHKAVRISGCTFSQLLDKISTGHPAVVWATYKMLVPKTVNSWYIIERDGSERYFEYPRGTHVMVLTGYTNSTVTVVDPCNGVCNFNIKTFENRWNLLKKQAIILE